MICYMMMKSLRFLDCLFSLLVNLVSGSFSMQQCKSEPIKAIIAFLPWLNEFLSTMVSSKS